MERGSHVGNERGICSNRWRRLVGRAFQRKNLVRTGGTASGGVVSTRDINGEPCSNRRLRLLERRLPQTTNNEIFQKGNVFPTGEIYEITWDTLF